MNFQGCVDLQSDNCELFSKAVGACQINEEFYVCDSSNRDQFKSLKNDDIRILEIGPYSNPYYRGENVKYFDAMTQEEIRFQIANEADPVIRNNIIANTIEINKVPHIDYINKSGDMSSINEKFDLIFSSHNIEHQIDLVSHLQQIEKLLNDNGQIILLVPDKRFCFDHFVPESPFSDILESYYNKDKFHPFRTILSMVCETTHNNPNKHLAGDNGEIKGKDVNCYKEALERYNNSLKKHIIHIPVEEVQADKNLDSNAVISDFQQVSQVIDAVQNEKVQGVFQDEQRSLHLVNEHAQNLDSNAAISDFQQVYINAHRWRFTPQQFSFVIDGLNKLDLIHLKIEKLHLTKKNHFEFYVILKKS